MKRLLHLAAIVFLAACSASAKTFDVDISTGRPAASNEAFYHGETIEFRAVRGRSVVTNIEYSCIWYQTNGMDSVWWHTDGLVFHPTNDCGAAAYRFFLEGRDDLGRDWHANGLLRFLPSPGFTPNALPLPVATLDFAQITVLNPPWSDVSADLTPATNYTDAVAAALSAADESLSSRLSLASLAATNYTDAAIADLPPPAETDPRFREWVGGVTNQYGIIAGAETAMFAYSLGGPAEEVAYSARDITAAIDDLREAIPTSAADLDAYPESSGEQLAQQVAAIGAHLNGEDARFVVTNYDSVTRIPEAYVEIKVSNDWLRVWDEGTRWNKYETWKTNVDEELSFKADRAWGIYDSETGGYSPAGFTQVSSSNILIASGMAYQRTVTSAGSVWVLQCNQGVAQVSGDTNGFFRVMDADGVTQFEIIKGDKREIGADADSINIVSGVTPTKLTIGYSVVSQTHPTLQICQSLVSPDWKDETDADCIATVTWSGQSGAYVATVQGKQNYPSMFIKASYEIGGETYIRNNAPVGMDSIILNGVKYYLGTAVISGHTVLTLSTTAP